MMRALKITLILFLHVLLLSCENDRADVKASEKKLEGSWELVSLDYVDSNGKAHTREPKTFGMPEQTILSLVESDRTGTLSFDGKTHAFTYLYGKEKCEFTFNKKGQLNVEDPNVGKDFIGQNFIYTFVFLSPNHNLVQFQSDQQYFKARKETVSNVRYAFRKLTL
ncbi:hypothetical protein MUK70_19065 [Dyadobacter chenwenxiniae]|uniref:Lipocalin-like domain-containing protein n=1 Tax=Dyadobacter chenwenxiniae TaxID=2906456 RepID=A0A9X1PHD3_9BACT|nr:hypothetical protein [Dyadobacter chenwenxiniae]MCF0061342.1 hypothetical protein [Dyadobacter chenwenxiniae]UON81164.1 hypothetical protein MUK70_19065 [Dyadobacter chenwenxiniae]